MIDVDLLSVIRRWHGRDQLSIREIARRTGLSRNTIKKYLANGEVTPTYPARKSVSKLDPFAETLASWLERESKRNSARLISDEMAARAWGILAASAIPKAE